MGTTYTVKQVGRQVVSRAQIEGRLKQINAIFSTWDKHSELSLFNQQPIGQWILVTDELFFVLAEAKKLSQQTAQYFDPGIGNLLDLWGFGTAQVGQKPSDKQVHAALKNSSIKFLQLKDGKAKKTQDIRLDLSAIAKGYGVDEIAKLLSNNNVKHFLVEIGGEVKTRGKHGNNAWKLGVEHPNKAELITIKLANQAIATSGNYRNYFIWKGKRYMHILNPINGLPAQNDLASVSVLHSQAMVADAYATAMMAMGSEKATTLAQQLNLSTLLILNQQADFQMIRLNFNRQTTQ